MEPVMNPTTAAANATTNAAETPVKKKRRGISNETKAVSNLKFSEADATNKGLFIAAIQSVEVTWVTVNATAGNLGRFTGNAIPRLNVHFVSGHANEAERRHVYLTIDPIGSDATTIPGGSDAKFLDGALGWIKHILDVYYLKGRQMTDNEEDALSLSYVDYEEDEAGNCTYVPVEITDVINGWRTLFENAAAMMNGTFAADHEATGKPCYKDANGKPILAFIKLLRYYKSKNGWKAVGNNGDLAFPSFVGEGCIEIMKNPTTPPAILKVNPIRESITPKEETQPKAPSMPGNIPGIPGVAASGNFGGGMAGDPYQSAADEMPF